MKKNSLELKKRQHQMLIELEKREMEKREKKLAARKEAAQAASSSNADEVVMKKPKYQRRVKPRREYKAERRRKRLAKYAPRTLSSETGDINMGDSSSKTKVSKTLRLVKDKSSISK